MSELFTFSFSLGMCAGLLFWSLYEHTPLPLIPGVIILVATAIAWTEKQTPDV
jgi:hypothetical protein